MGAIVYDAIHIKIKTVKLRYAVFSNELRNRRIPLTQPAKELWDTHDGWKKVQTFCLEENEEVKCSQAKGKNMGLNNRSIEL